MVQGVMCVLRPLCLLCGRTFRKRLAHARCTFQCYLFANLPNIIIIDTAVAATVTAGHHTAYIHHNLIRAHYGTGGVNEESGKDGKEGKERSILNDC